MSIGEQLRKAMTEAGFPSEMELERASGVKQPTINRILNLVGSKGPQLETVKQLARACGVSFEWLNEGLGIATKSTDIDVSAVPELARQFGRRVKAVREAAGLTQTELGVRMNMPPMYAEMRVWRRLAAVQSPLWSGISLGRPRLTVTT